MADLNAALQEFLQLERDLVLARIDGADDFLDRWEATSGTWFHGAQSNFIESGMFYGDAETEKEWLRPRDIYRVTTHQHPELGDALVAHLSEGQTDHAGYTNRLALATVDGTPKVVGWYERCTMCDSEGCDEEDFESGSCQNTGWLHHLGVPHPADFGAALSTNDLLAPEDEFSRKLLARS